MHKKVIIFGGGTGLSSMLKGLKEFPVDITAVITVSDNGRSTGKLRKEFNLPAIGDIRKVITNLSNTNSDIKKMMEYRFDTTSDLDGHTVGNLILASMIDITGSLKDAIKNLSTLLDVTHTVLPISLDPDLTLKALMEDGSFVEGEEQITKSNKKIKKIFYNKEPKVTAEVIEKLKEADLIIFSMGSLYTSLLPNIICSEIIKTIDELDTKIMYVCNAISQPGETDNFTVFDHVKLINSYLNKRKIDVVIASNTKISKEIALKYESEEQKDPVIIDYDKLNKNVELIVDDLLILEDNMLRHDGIKLGTLIMSYLMR